jgi:hypothetical protein
MKGALTMTGLILHPLRHKALSEGRLSVLRVPFREQPKCFYHFVHVLNSLGYPASDGFAWAGFDYRPDNPDPIYFRAPYAPGDYFVKEAWCCEVDPLTSKPTGKILYKADGQEVMLDDGDGSWAENKDGTFASPWSSPMHMKEEDARYIVTLGPPVPGRLGEVTEEMMIEEGIEHVGGTFSCNPWRNYRIGKKGEMSMHCSAPTRSLQTMWNTIYPRHPWHSGLWTWAYPVTWRRR